MDSDATRPIAETRTVVYRCPCGNRLTLQLLKGGECDRCGRVVSPKSLAFDQSNTVSWEDQSFDLAKTHPGIQSGIVSGPHVIFDEDQGDADAHLLNGKMFGHFEIIAPIGRGGMGQVYRALDTSLQRYVAVKVLRSGIGSSEDHPAMSSDTEIDKLLQEAISQARVPHPNIVTIYFVGKDQGNPFLAMELVNGDTLSQRIADGDLTFEETARLGGQLAQALRASFELDIIHGDIKPSNVLISRDGIAKLSDFGMARSASENNSVAEGGTPNYLAPELLRGEPTSIQSDMYALGVTLFEMTFGELPLKMIGNNIRDWIESHELHEVTFPQPWPPDIPEAWRGVLARLLKKDPTERYEDYDQLIEDLERLQPHSDVSARFFPRLIAAGIDWGSVLLGTIGFQAALHQIYEFEVGLLGIPVDGMWALLLGILALVPIACYFFGIYRWRHTFGRSLMHLKAVNQYGLRPTGIRMAWRSLLRMQFPIIVILMQLLLSTPLAVVVLLGFISSIVFLLMDLVYMVFSSGSSLHDLIAGTRVVLDTDGRSKEVD